MLRYNNITREEMETFMVLLAKITKSLLFLSLGITQCAVAVFLLQLDRRAESFVVAMGSIAFILLALEVLTRLICND